MITKSTALAACLAGGILLAGGSVAALKWTALARAQQPGATAVVPPAGPTEPEPTGHRALSTRRLKQILTACWGFENTFGVLPPAATNGGDGHQPMLSWRVAILPQLGELALFNQFHLDEPWDSPHNKTLIARMPAVFATPDAPTPAGETRIRGFQHPDTLIHRPPVPGPKTMFDGGTIGIAVRDVPDGTANTIMLVAARESIVWTKPGELPFEYGQPIPPLATSDPARVRVAMVNGSVLDLVPPPERLLTCLISRDGGEVINRPQIFNLLIARQQLASTTPEIAPPDPPAAGGMATGMGGSVPPAPVASSVEERLQRLEEKLDRLLRKFEAQTNASDVLRPLEPPR